MTRKIELDLDQFQVLPIRTVKSSEIRGKLRRVLRKRPTLIYIDSTGVYYKIDITQEQITKELSEALKKSKENEIPSDIRIIPKEFIDEPPREG